MGKAAPRRKRIHSARHAAASAPTSTPTAPADAQPAKPRERPKEVIPVIEQLGSRSADERMQALQGIQAIVAESDASTRRVLQAHAVVARLIERLADTDIECRVESVTVLRSLAIEGGPEICAEVRHGSTAIFALAKATALVSMVNKKILAALSPHLGPLAALVGKALEPEQPAPTPLPEPVAGRKLVWTWSESLVTLLWCLTESVPKAMPALTALTTLPPLLLRIVSGVARRDIEGRTAVHAPLPCCIAAAQCLSALTDANPALSTLLVGKHAEALDGLLSLISSATSSSMDPQRLLRVLVAGVLHNIATSILTDDATDVDVAIDMRAGELKGDIDRLVPRVLARNLDGADLQALAAARNGPALEILQSTLEVLGELFACLDGLLVEPEPNEIAEDLDGTDEWGGIDTDADTTMDEPAPANGNVEMSSPAGRTRAPPSLSLTADSETILTSLPPVLLRLARPTAAGFKPTFDTPAAPGLIPTATPAGKSVDPTSSLVTAVHVRALECLNNLLVTLARTPGGDAAVEAASPLPMDAQTLWQGLFEILVPVAQTPAPATAAGSTDDADDDRERVLEAGVGAVWALARGWIDRLDVGADEIPFLLGLLGTGAGIEARMRCAGVLASLAARQTVGVTENAIIGSALLDLATSTSTPLALSVQALDGLIDVYADELRDYDAPVFRQQDILSKLVALLPTLRARAKQVDKRREPDLRTAADAVVANLTAFVR